MPLYDFSCAECGTLTEVRAPVDELDRLSPQCSRCGGSSLRRLLSTVSVLRGDKAAAGHGCGGCASGCACSA